MKDSSSNPGLSLKTYKNLSLELVMYFLVDLTKRRRARFLSPFKKVCLVFNGKEILIPPNIPTRTMRENRKMKWMFRCWDCDFTLLKVLSLFIVCCTVKIKARRKDHLTHNSTHASLAGAQGPLPWPQLEPLQENYKDRNFPSLLAQPGCLQVGLGLRGGDSQGSPEDFMKISTVPTRGGKTDSEL